MKLSVNLFNPAVNPDNLKAYRAMHYAYVNNYDVIKTNMVLNSIGYYVKEPVLEAFYKLMQAADRAHLVSDIG